MPLPGAWYRLTPIAEEGDALEREEVVRDRARVLVDRHGIVFRELLQCDADLVGATGDAADAEMLVVMAAAYRALDVGTVVLRFNDRRVLQGLLETRGAAELSTPVLRALDKLDKQSPEAVAEEMQAAGLPDPLP